MTVQELEKHSPASVFYDMKDQMKQFIYNYSNEFFAAGDAARNKIDSIERLDAYRMSIRNKFIESIGGLPEGDTPLNAKVAGIEKCEGFKIEKIIFESRPKVYVTANLYIPDGITAPRGAVLFLCGHHEQAKHSEEYQIVCRYLVHAGLIVLSQDPIGQGERFSYYERSIKGTTVSWGCKEHDYAGSQCLMLGDSLARYFIHDAMRGVDYLCTRPEVDPAKIGITGNSGGGTQTSMMMVCDGRIAAAAPATFITNRQTNMYTGMAQDSEQIWPGMTRLGFDHEDILLSMAPRPVLVLAVTGDFFPIEGTRKTVERTKRFWKMYDKSDFISLFEDTSDHHYTQLMAKSAVEFFSLHLLGKKATPSDEGIIPIMQSQLWCTGSGQIRGDIEDARSIYDENYERLAEIEKERNVISEPGYKAKALEWLEEKIFAGRKPCDLNIRHIAVSSVDGLETQASTWWSQEGIFNHAYTFKDYHRTGEKLPVTIAVWDGGTGCIQSHLDWIQKKCSSGKAVIVLDVTGIGAIAPNTINYGPSLDFYGTIHKLADDLIWLNDSLVAIRAYDVTRALDAIAVWNGLETDSVELYAYGRYGLYGQLAAVLDRRIKAIEICKGIGCFSDIVKNRHYDCYDINSIILPGILKYFDLYDLEKWIEERKSTEY